MLVWSDMFVACIHGWWEYTLCVLLHVYMVGGNILCVCVCLLCMSCVCVCSVQQLCGHALTVTSLLLLFCVLGSRLLCPPPPPLTTCSNSSNYGILLQSL